MQFGASTLAYLTFVKASQPLSITGDGSFARTAAPIGHDAAHDTANK